MLMRKEQMMWEKIKAKTKWLRHNQFAVAAIVASMVLVFWIYGCDSKTTSPWDSSKQITRTELATEVKTYNIEVEAAVADLDKQDAFKKELVTVGVAIAEAGGLNPAGVGVGVMLLGVLGLTADNRKKSAIIKTLKNGNGNGGATNA
jgi:hypothetical protein